MDRSDWKRWRRTGWTAVLWIALVSQAGADAPATRPGLSTVDRGGSAWLTRAASAPSPQLAVVGGARGCNAPAACMCGASPAVSGFAYTYDTLDRGGQGRAPAAVRATRLPDPAPGPLGEAAPVSRNL